MNQLITMPLWLVLLMLCLATLAIVDRFLLPSARWFMRRRVHNVIEDLRTHLNIRMEDFKLTKREVLIDRLMFDEEVQTEANAFAIESDISREEVMARVEGYAREIVPAFNAYFYFRFGYFVARRLAQLLYRVRLGFAPPETYDTIDPSSTVVFVMNHRSNMDYVLVAYLAASKAALSYAVGEWAQVWPLEGLVRAMGAYFVRRRSRNSLYRKVLSRYVNMATTNGLTQAMYPEGGLSRDGSLGPAKLGLLDYMLRSYDPEGPRDLVFIPVGLNYDRVLEDRSLLLDLSDDAPRKSGFATIRTTGAFLFRNLWKMARGRWFRFGYVCVNFGPPISMRAYCREHDLKPACLNREERFARVAEVGAHLMEHLEQQIPVLPVPLIATVFLEAGTRQLSELEIKANAHALMGRLEKNNAKLYIPRRDHDYTITVGLRSLLLRQIVEEVDGLFRACPDEAALLRYYANSIAGLVDP